MSKVDYYTQYRPRRSAARWLEDAPEYVMAVHDNGGRSCDRYTIVLGGSEWSPDYARVNAEYGRDPCLTPCLCLSAHRGSQSVSIWAECRRGAHLGRKIRWLDLPENVRAHVVSRVRDANEAAA